MSDRLTLEDEIRRDHRQRDHDEGPVQHSGMGYLQAGLVDPLRTEDQDIDVDEARAPSLPSNAFQPGLDGQAEIEQHTWRVVGVHRCTAFRKSG